MAVDWSGRVQGERRTIWVAHVTGGALSSLANGRDRDEVIDHLVGGGRRCERLVVGLDFAFSFPAWFLHLRGVASAHQLWQMAAVEGEEWLRTCPWPFWGRPGRRRPELPGHFRLTERPAVPDPGILPKSVFQVGGAGAVGTGSLRGMPLLARLHDAGFSIWPFDEPGWPRVVEIYPRLLTGAVRKSDREAREHYLEAARWSLPPLLSELAASSEDAFDAAISALVLAEHAASLGSLERASDPRTALEGSIWRPDRAS